MEKHISNKRYRTILMDPPWDYILEIWPVLLVVTVVIATAVTFWRIWRN